MNSGRRIKFHAPRQHVTSDLIHLLVSLQGSRILLHRHLSKDRIDLQIADLMISGSRATRSSMQRFAEGARNVENDAEPAEKT